MFCDLSIYERKMSEKTRITFYSIDKCGYYRFGETERSFCTLLETLNELKTWNSDKEIGATCTYELDTHRYTYRTYCFNLIQINNDFLLTTWNETPLTDSKMTSVNISSPVGNVQVNLTAVPEDNIPGYATYFWFIPDHEILATVQFHNQLNGHKNLLMYLNGFLSKCTKWACVKEQPTNGNEEKLKIIGYAENDTSPPEHLYPKFDTSLYKKKVNHIDFIKNNYMNIKKIIRKDLINMKIKQDDEMFKTFLERLHLQKPVIIEEKMKVKYEINYTPSSDELSHMIDSWLQSHDNEEKWDDIGFVLKNQTDKIYWLSHELPRDEFTLDLKRESNGIINAQSLLSELVNNRDFIISKIIKP